MLRFLSLPSCTAFLAFVGNRGLVVSVVWQIGCRGQRGLSVAVERAVLDLSVPTEKWVSHRGLSKLSGCPTE